MIGFADYERYDALGLAELVRRRDVSPSDLLDAAIERVEARNAAVNAVVMPLYDYGRKAIEDGLPNGPRYRAKAGNTVASAAAHFIDFGHAGVDSGAGWTAIADPSGRVQQVHCNGQHHGACGEMVLDAAFAVGRPLSRAPRGG